MKKIFLVLVLLVFGSFAVYATGVDEKEIDAEYYVAFEHDSVEVMANASDEDLPDLYDKYSSDLSDYLSFYLTRNRVQNSYQTKNSYQKRWHIAIQDSYKRYLLIRAKNSGNYRIAGDSTWLSFQDKYVIANIFDRIITACEKAGYDVTREELRQIVNELQNDAKLIDEELNTDQKEWIDNIMSNLAILAIGTAGYPNAYGVVVQWRDQLSAEVDLRNGIEAWWTWRLERINKYGD
jgi:hypothetical protein